MVNLEFLLVTFRKDIPTPCINVCMFVLRRGGGGREGPREDMNKYRLVKISTFTDGPLHS